MWTWKRQLADADRKVAESEARSQAAEETVEKARQARQVLHRKVGENGWTELFLASMQRGH